MTASKDPTAQEAKTVVAKENKGARVSFAPGEATKYIIVQGTHEEPYPGDNGRVYEGPAGLQEAQHRVEWLNWSSQSKARGTYHHPREEAAAKREAARAQLLAAHRELLERERLGTAVALQLRALRAALAAEEQVERQQLEWAAQDGRSTKDRRASKAAANAAHLRAQGLKGKIAELEGGPVQPSRLAGGPAKAEEEEDADDSCA